MSTQTKVYQEQAQPLQIAENNLSSLRLFASAIVFIIGCAIILNMRAKLIGEDGATMAMYCLGVLFILTMNLMLFSSKLQNPEVFALKCCLVAVIFTGAWVNIEEKIVMPMLSSQCDNDCVQIYERTVPFADVDVIYREGRGWRVLD